jgi:hypothetical protein
LQEHRHRKTAQHHAQHRQRDVPKVVVRRPSSGCPSSQIVTAQRKPPQPPTKDLPVNPSPSTKFGMA